MSIEYSIVNKCLFIYVISFNESGLHWLNSNNFKESKCKELGSNMEYERDVKKYYNMEWY